MKRKINLNEVTAKEPVKVDTEINSSIMNLPKEEVSNSSTFKLHIEVTKKPIGYGLKGNVKGEVELTCSRCNKKFMYQIDRDFEYKLLPTAEITGGEIKSSELDVKFSDSDILDLAEVVEEQIILDLPVKPLCDDNCQVPWEESSDESDSSKEVKDKRWEKLKALKDKLSKEK